MTSHTPIHPAPATGVKTGEAFPPTASRRSTNSDALIIARAKYSAVERQHRRLVKIGAQSRAKALWPKLRAANMALMALGVRHG